jgi:5-methylcytosine-specific restriction endonuclease McrA
MQLLRGLIMQHLQYARLYDSSKWKRLRLNQLQSSPLCAYCLKLGRISNATIADHIKPHKGNESLFYSPDNLQSLCKHCHDSVKQQQEKSGIVRGSDINGWPIDNARGWN